MGAVFALTFLPLIAVVLGAVVALAIAGAAVFVIGVSGSIVAASAQGDRGLKRASLCFFASLLLLGASCVAALAGLFTGTDFFVLPMLAAVGAAVVALGIAGIVGACGTGRKAAKAALIVLLSLATGMGAVVLSTAALLLVLV